MARYIYKRHDQKFVNPYNFVKLGTGCVKNINYLESKEASDAISGWLECELELKSPIFIPNSSNDRFFGQWHPEQDGDLKSYEFYSYNNLKNTHGNQQTPPPANPVIPGSEIRGMIRTAYEALTNSCLSTIDPKMSFHKRAPKSDKSGKPGILRKNATGWEIVPCIRYMLKTSRCFDDLFEFNPPYTQNYTPPYTDWPAWRKHMADLEKNNSQVWIRPGARYKRRPYMDCLICEFKESYTPGLQMGYVHVTAHFEDKKHHDSVFVEQGIAPIPISPDVACNYLENLKFCIAHDTFGPEYAHLDKGDNIDKYNNVCVYYTEYGGNKYLSPSMINREMLYKKLGDRISNYKPCDDPNHLCPACSLFGMVSDKGSVSSRLRFSDAEPVAGTTEFMAPVLLEELASPKPSATEFYLESPPNQANWNYDYQMRWFVQQNNGRKVTLLQKTNYTAKIRGRKFYWHQPRVKTSSLLSVTHLNEEQKKKLLRMCLVRPLEKGKFKFKVFFDRVSKYDVYKLAFILTIGFSTDHAHKIGMGKPLGLGSVQLDVKVMSIRELDNNCERKHKRFDLTDLNTRNSIRNRFGNTLGNNGILDQFLALAKVNHNYEVRYPYILDEHGAEKEENYAWFVANKQIEGIGRPNNPKIDQTLREPNDPLQQVIEELTQENGYHHH